MVNYDLYIGLAYAIAFVLGGALTWHSWRARRQAEKRLQTIADSDSSHV